MSNQIQSILLVDDDQDDKYFFTTALEEVDPGVKLSTAADGFEALEKLKTSKPDLILLDLVMPRMNGLRCMKELKRLKYLADIPVVIYTADLSFFERQELLRLGAEKVVLKPVDFDSTVKTIRDLLALEVYLKSA